MINFSLISKCLLISITLHWYGHVVAVTNQDNTIDQDPKTELNSAIKLQPKVKIFYNEDKLVTFNIKDLNLNLTKYIVLYNDKFKLKPSKSKLEPGGFKSAISIINSLDIVNNRYVVGFEKDNMQYLGGMYDRVLVSGLDQEKYFNYMLLRPDCSYYHPDTNEYLGTMFLNIGTAALVTRGKLSVLEINKVYDPPVKTGTLIMPSHSLLSANKITVVPGIKDLTGYILSINTENIEAVNKDIVLIGLGYREGVKVGNVFKIFKQEFKTQDPYKNKKKYPYTKHKGDVLIYDVFEKLSLGLVIKCYQPIQVLDKLIAN